MPAPLIQSGCKELCALLQQERAGIPPIAVDPAKIKAVMDADEK